jgi:hypothetical protein
MSTILYGRLTRARAAAPAPRRLQLALPQATDPRAELLQELSPGFLDSHPEVRAELDAAAEAEPPDDRTDVSHWIDIAAALVPAEVLGIHALVMAFASETVIDSNGDPGTVIAEPKAVTILFWVLVALAAFLFLASAGFSKLTNWARALLVAVAFVCWTMLQKDTAFDALKIDFAPSWLRPVVAVIVVVVVAAAVKLLAGNADEEPGGE